MSKLSTFIKSSTIYLVGNILTKVIPFLLLPLYTNYISPVSMGYYDVSNSYMNIIVPIVSLSIWAAILRYCFDFEKTEDKYMVITNAMAVFVVSSAVYSIATFLIGRVYSIQYLFLIYLMGLAMILQNCYSNMARALGYNAVFAMSGVVGSFVNCGSNIMMILFLGMREESLFIALTLGLLTQVFIMEMKVQFLKHVEFKRIDPAFVKKMIRFTAPLALNSACFWFLSSYDKIGISQVLGLESSGIYAIAAKYTYVIGLLSDCFRMAMQELLFSLGKGGEEKKHFYTVSSNYCLKFLTYGLLLLISFVYFTFPVLIGKNYSAAFSLIPLYLVATVGNVYCNFLGDIFATEKKTSAVFYSTIVAAVVNVSLFHLLVGTFQIQAANIALSAGFLVDIIVRLCILKKWYPICLDYKMLIFTGILFCISTYFYMTQGTMVNVVWTFCICVIIILAFRDFLTLLSQKLHEIFRRKKSTNV